MIKLSEGILNIASGLIVGFHFLLPFIILRYTGLYLVIKGIVYLILYSPKEGAAFLDSGIGIYLIIMSFGFSSIFVSILISLYLLIKGSIEVFGP